MRRVAPLILGGTLIGLVGTAKKAEAVVYIGDPSLDVYKQKTDQTFYDVYQNPESALGGQVQSVEEAADFFNSIPTSNRIAEGNYLNRVRQGTVEGGQLPEGSWAWITVFGKKYKIVATSNGIQILDENEKPVDKPPEELELPTQWKQLSATVREGTGRKGVFIPATGDYYEYTVKVRQTRPSWVCGKSVCYGEWGNTQIVDVLNVQTKHYNLANAILQGGLTVNFSEDVILDYAEGEEYYVNPPSKPGMWIMLPP